MNVDFKAIALKLGLPETATEAEILAKVGILLGYQTANTELRTQLDAMKLAGVTQMVDDAIKAGKFNARREKYSLTWGKTVGAENLKLTWRLSATDATDQSRRRNGRCKHPAMEQAQRGTRSAAEA